MKSLRGIEAWERGKGVGFKMEVKEGNSCKNKSVFSFRKESDHRYPNRKGVTKTVELGVWKQESD